MPRKPKPEPSGLDEFHPDTTHNPDPARIEGQPIEPARPAIVDRHGGAVPDRRTRYRTE